MPSCEEHFLLYLDSRDPDKVVVSTTVLFLRCVELARAMAALTESFTQDFLLATLMEIRNLPAQRRRGHPTLLT